MTENKLKDEIYYFHQTPKNLAVDLIKNLPIEETDIVLEPFKGEGAFYDAFPKCNKKYCEITEGLDYKDYKGDIDWVVSNPPFRLENKKGKRVNSFFPLLEYYSHKVNKGIAFLGNDYCFSTLTPLRMKKLNDVGLYLQGYTICNIKKWRGRYFFMVFTKKKNNNIKYLLKNY